MDAKNKQLMVLGYLIHAAGLASLIVGGCVYHFVVSAVLTHQQRLNAEETARLEHLLDGAGDVRRKHSELTQRLADLERRAEEIRDKIPDQPQESDFLEQISTAAKARGLVIENYTRGGVTTTATHSLLEIRMTGAGDFRSICGFFEEMANLSRVATVRRMHLAIPTNSEIYPLDITLTLYSARGLKVVPMARTPGAKGGLTPAKLGMIIVLSIIFLVVCIVQFGGERRLQPRRKPSRRSAEATATPNPGGGREQARNSEQPFDPWPAYELQDLLEHNPFSLPMELRPPPPAEPEPVAEAGENVPVEPWNRELRRRQAELMASLKDQGVDMVIVSPHGRVARVGAMTFREGDLVEGLVVKQISAEGIVFVQERTLGQP